MQIICPRARRIVENAFTRRVGNDPLFFTYGVFERGACVSEHLKASIRSEGGASVPGGQAAVRVREGALSQARQERRTGDDAVHVGELVDGTQADTGHDRIGAPAIHEMEAK